MGKIVFIVLSVLFALTYPFIPVSQHWICGFVEGLIVYTAWEVTDRNFRI